VLENKKILLGVTGSIAAYKAAILVRMLVKEGAEVKVLMTDLAKAFITPLTLATLSKNPVLVEFYNPENGDWNNHVDLGTWADAFLVAPATANTLAKMAHGIADNLLLTTYLSARCPVFVAPAMDMDMFRHQATMDNISILKNRGVNIIEPSTGELASGLEGKGRMEEPEVILDVLQKHFLPKSSQKKKHIVNLKGKSVLVTAGPTYEAIDPVRYIGNHSSGRMGFAIARELALLGAKVYLVSGPSSIQPPDGLTFFQSITSADQMFKTCRQLIGNCDIAIFAAAVADYKPVRQAKQKMKSLTPDLLLPLEKTVDIAAEFGRNKKKSQFFVGFALETEKEIENARMKLSKKNLDLIVLNSLKDKGAGFGYETNKISILDKDNKIHKFGLKMKSEVAYDIISLISEKI